MIYMTMNIEVCLALPVSEMNFYNSNAKKSDRVQL